MAQPAPVVIHFKDLDSNERVRENVEKRCQRLAEEFHEISHVEITIVEDGAGYAAQGHVTGKNIDLGTHAAASELAPAVDQLLDKIGRQLRRVHDKRIFAQRRDAQRDAPKRRTVG